MSTALRTYSRGARLASIEDNPGAKTYVPHYDHQGTVQCLTDRVTGAVTDRFAADAWGLQVKRTGTSISRVRLGRCRPNLPSEPDVQVSSHPAQARRAHPRVLGTRGPARTGLVREALWSSVWASRWSAAVSRPMASGKAG
jgi:hypothetical protein